MIGIFARKLGRFNLEDDGTWTGNDVRFVQRLSQAFPARTSGGTALGDFGLFHFFGAVELFQGTVVMVEKRNAEPPGIIY